MIKQAVIVTFILNSIIIALPAKAESFVWKVSKDNNYFYLGGTIHLLNQDDHPLPKEFFIAYDDSTKIVLETNFDKAQSSGIQLKLISAMLYKNGRTLSDDINPSTLKKLKEFLNKRQLPLDNFLQFQPWGVALALSLNEYVRLGQVPELGVDMHFNNRANKDNKKVSGLETPEQQIKFLSTMAGANPNHIIEHTLRDLDSFPDLLFSLKEHWRNGNTQSFSENMLLLNMEKEFPEIYYNLLTKRNNLWMNDLISFTNNKEKEFVLVGAMHLVGKTGLLKQLSDRGFTIEQL